MEKQKDIEINSQLKTLPSNQVIRLHNITCVYCGTLMQDEERTKEHVIARKFIPKGKLNRNWNLIVYACGSCNGVKADLENDISAITMQSDLTGEYGHEDKLAITNALRKSSNAISRRTRKAVKDSHETLKVDGNLAPGVKLSMNFTSPAQIDQDRVFELARLQLMAFFYWITYDEDTRRGCFWPEGFYPVMTASRLDWGNPVLVSFADKVVGWEPRIIASNAEGFFKLVIRRHPTSDCWSWSFEWNHNMRVIGFFGNKQAAQEVGADFPKLKFETLSAGPDHSMRYRTETPRNEEQDKMFYWKDMFSDRLSDK